MPKQKKIKKRSSYRSGLVGKNDLILFWDYRLKPNPPHEDKVVPLRNGKEIKKNNAGTKRNMRDVSIRPRP